MRVKEVLNPIIIDFDFYSWFLNNWNFHLLSKIFQFLISISYYYWNSNFQILYESYHFQSIHKLIWMNLLLSLIHQWFSYMINRRFIDWSFFDKNISKSWSLISCNIFHFLKGDLIMICHHIWFLLDFLWSRWFEGSSLFRLELASFLQIPWYFISFYSENKKD